MTQTSLPSRTGSALAFEKQHHELRKLLKTLMKEQHELAHEAFYLAWWSAGMLQYQDEAGTIELTGLLASFTTWASHRQHLGNC